MRVPCVAEEKEARRLHGGEERRPRIVYGQARFASSPAPRADMPIQKDESPADG